MKYKINASLNFKREYREMGNGDLRFFNSKNVQECMVYIDILNFHYISI